MKIMITGAEGFAASRIMEAWKDRHELWGVSRRQMDITDRDETRRVICEYSPEIVLHCGAISDLAVCDNEPERSGKINVDGAENVAAACRESGSRMVFFSSDQVYFGNDAAGPAGRMRFCLRSGFTESRSWRRKNGAWRYFRTESFSE